MWLTAPEGPTIEDVTQLFDSLFVKNAIDRSAENRLDRRRFLRAAGLTGVGVGAATLLSAPEALAQESGGPSDAAILNFALNLEYLEAEFYAIAATGERLAGSFDGVGSMGGVTGGNAVSFQTPAIKQYAEEIAKDEKQHVEFLRTALGSAAVSRPEINLDASFAAAAKAAGITGPFDPYANETNFLLAAFIFEDVGVTAYKGAAPLISNKTYLSAAAGILAAEAYHAGLIRTSLYNLGIDVQEMANKISAARGSLDGVGTDDQGISIDGVANIVPTDENAIAFGRTPGAVLNIVYLTPGVATSGGFFPNGVNGSLNQSGGGAMPTGGAGAGGGGTSGGRDTELLIGGAVAAVGAVAAAGAYQHNRKTAAAGTSADVENLD